MTAAAPLKIALPPLYPAQLEIAKHPARFKVVANGRRWGKTVLGVTLCFRSGLLGGRIWWIAPIYSIAKEGWDMAKFLARQLPQDVARIHEADKMISFPRSGGRVEVKSADDPDHLRGAGLDGLVLDEAANIKEETWSEVLRPTLADKHGWALFISTPKGRNWFYKLHEGARDRSEWAAWQLSTYTNPYIDDAEIDAMKAEMSDTEFQQEVMASFLVSTDQIYTMFDRSKHMLPMPKEIRWGEGAIGADYGDVHLSTCVAGRRDHNGRIWVRATWAGDGDTGKWLGAMTAQCAEYGIGRSRIRVDPTQRSIANAYGFKPAETGAGSRSARIGLVKRLLNTGGLIIDLAAPGALQLADEIEAYRWEQNADGTLKDSPHRIGEDRVAALEYMVEELERPGAAIDATPDKLRALGTLMGR